jgi:hypothetical protein
MRRTLARAQACGACRHGSALDRRAARRQAREGTRQEVDRQEVDGQAVSRQEVDEHRRHVDASLARPMSASAASVREERRRRGVGDVGVSGP